LDARKNVIPLSITSTIKLLTQMTKGRS
jgi:hypothetical protein